METAGRHEDGHPVEKLPDLAKPSDPLPLALQDMGKDSVVAVDKPPVDRRKIDVARPATDPEGEKSALSRPSTES
ncbi:MAG: hypothetical protein NWR42_11505, partial [Desulfobacterales bacterium]|nr:hypothetical protein [Desulfobacterales bacterium]